MRTLRTRVLAAVAGGALAGAAIIGAAAPASAHSSPAPASTPRANAPAAPAAGSTVSAEVEEPASSSGYIEGMRLTLTNTTAGPIAYTFFYDGPTGGQADWKWLQPGESTTKFGASFWGADIYDSWLYVPATGQQISFEAKLSCSSETSLTVDGKQMILDRGETKSDHAGSQSYKGHRQAEDYNTGVLDGGIGDPAYIYNPQLTLTLQ